VRKVTHAQKRYAWANRDELLHRCRGPRRNHLCQLLWLSLLGFERGGGSNFGFLHWLALSLLQHSRTTVRVCDRDLEMWVRGHSRSLKMVLFESGFLFAFYHGLHGSAGTVLTAITLSYGKWRNLTPRRIKTGWDEIVNIWLRPGDMPPNLFL